MHIIFGKRRTIPNAFTFTPVPTSALSTLYTSNTITVSGLGSGISVGVSITGGTYSKNSGGYVSSSGTAVNGDTFSVRQTSASTSGTAQSTTLTIGGMAGAFVVTTTSAVNAVPSAFSFTSVTNAAPSTQFVSNTITVSGMDVGVSAAVTVAGGAYSKNGLAYTTAAGTAVDGDTFALRLTSSSANSTGVSAILTIGGVSGTFLVTTLASVGGFDRWAELPHSEPTRPASLTITGTTATVSTAAALQTAINNAAAADGSLNHEIIVTAGAILSAGSGGFNLPPKSGTNASGTGWIRIRTSGAALPAAGTRVTPTDASAMAKVVVPSGGFTSFRTSPNAHHYWLQGIEIYPDPGVTLPDGLLLLGDPYVDQTGIQPHDFIVDRCYIHGLSNGSYSSTNPEYRNAIAMNCANGVVIDCYISEIHSQAVECHGIICYNGTGPLLYQNNRIEASSSNIFFGGGGSSPGFVPTDVTIRGNHVIKPPGWWQSDLGYSIKNLMECKNGSRMLVENNYMEHSWDSTSATALFFNANGDGQKRAVSFWAVNQSGQTWAKCDDITFRYNSISSLAGCFSLLTGSGTALGSHRFSIHDNVFWNTGGEAGCVSSDMIEFVGGNGLLDRVDMRNNTFNFTGVYPPVAGYLVAIHNSGSGATNLIFRDNILGTMGTDGIDGVGVFVAANAITSFWGSNAEFDGNLAVATAAYPQTKIASDFPAGNSSVANASGVGWINSTPTQLSDMNLTTGARALTAGVGGVRCGADVPTVISRTAGVASGTVVTGSAPVNTSAPQMGGPPAQVGLTLTMTTGSWTNSPTAFHYQWIRTTGNVNVGSDANAYVPTNADVGSTVYCVVTAVNAAGSGTAIGGPSFAVISAPSAPLAVAAPVISGTPQVSVTLSVSNGTWNNSPTSYAYQWRRGGTTNIGTNANTYVPISADTGSTITCIVTASNVSGSGSSESAPTGVVTAIPALPPANTALPVISGTAQVGFTLSVSTGTWNYAPTSYAYQWQRGATNIGTNSPTYAPVTGDVGSTLTCTVTATNNIGSTSATSAATASIIAAGIGSFDQTAELPRVVPVPPSTFPTINGTTATPSTASALQSAINAAAAADGNLNHLISLPAQSIMVGNFTLPPKSGTNSAGTGWIIITTQGTLPARGTRIRPTVHGPQLGHIRCPANDSDGTAVLATQNGAHHYWVCGLEMETNPTNPAGQITYTLVGMGSSGTDWTTAIEPHDIIIDRCWIHGQTDSSYLAASPAVNHGLTCNMGTMAIVDNWIEEIHSTAQDTQAIFGGGGHGPTYINNNYLQGAGENIMFGGFDPATIGLVQADVTFTNNHCQKPTRWYQSDLGYSVKNLIEMKSVKRILIEKNVCDTTWDSSGGASTGITHFAGGQDTAIVLKVVNQDGGGTWLVTDDLTLRWNYIANAPVPIGMTGVQWNGAPSEGCHRWSIHDNAFVNMASIAGNVGANNLLFMGTARTTSGGSGMQDYYFCNNTIHVNPNTSTKCGMQCDNTVGSSTGGFGKNLTMRNNIIGWMGLYGIYCQGPAGLAGLRSIFNGVGTGAAYSSSASTVILEGNLCLCIDPGGYTTSNLATDQPNDTGISTQTGVTWANPNATQLSDVVLVGGPALTSGRNGTSYSGADIATLTNKIAGVVVGR